MRVALCASGRVGEELTEFVCSQPVSPSIVFVKSADPYHQQIINVCNAYGTEWMEVESINDPAAIKVLKHREIGIVFLLWWPDIVKRKAIESVPGGFVNLHPSLLPYNRGMHPYYWSIVEGTPAGVSIHFIDDNIDSGSLICQREITTDITTTGYELYEIAQSTIVSLFKEKYDDIVSQRYELKDLDLESGTFHLRKELDIHSCIDLNKEYTASELLDILRARNFPGGPSSFFYLGDKKYYVNVSITEA